MQQHCTIKSIWDDLSSSKIRVPSGQHRSTPTSTNKPDAAAILIARGRSLELEAEIFSDIRPLVPLVQTLKESVESNSNCGETTRSLECSVDVGFQPGGSCASAPSPTERVGCAAQLLISECCTAPSSLITSQAHPSVLLGLDHPGTDAAERRQPMEANRRTAIAFGVFLIAAIVCGLLNSVPAIESPNYLEKLASLESRILVAVFFQAVMATIYVAIAVIMYPIVKMDSPNGALAYFAFRVIGATFSFVGIVTLLLLLALGRHFAQADAPNVADFEMIGALLRQARDGLNHIGAILPWSIGGVFLYLAFLRTRLVPRWLSIWGLVGTALTLVATILYMLDQIQIVTITYIGLVSPTALFELTLAVYLIARGFRQTSPSWTPSPSN